MKKNMLKLLPLGLVLIILFYYVIRQSNENNERLAIKDDWITIYQYKADFESPGKVSFIPHDSIKFEGNHSAIITKDNLYGPTFFSDSLQIIKKINKLEVRCKLLSKTALKDMRFIASVENEKGSVYWKSSGLGDKLKANEWGDASTYFEVDPHTFNDKGKLFLKVYLLNDKGEECVTDNFEIIAYQRN